jgi:hypothetical protein
VYAANYTSVLLTAVTDAHRIRSQRAPRQRRPRQCGAAGGAGGGTDARSSPTLGIPHTQRHTHPARLALTQEFAEAQLREGRQRGGGGGRAAAADELTRSKVVGDVYVSSFCYICVLILPYIRADELTRSFAAVIYVSSFCYICVLVLLLIRVLILLYIRADELTRSEAPAPHSV